ncbi:ATP-binding protein [Ureibacillus sp. NPDC094379]
MKLKSKIHLFTTILMLLLLVVINLSVYVLFEKISMNTEYEQLKARSEELLMTLQSLDRNIDSDQVLRAYMPSNGAIRVVNEQERPITIVEAALSFDHFDVKNVTNKGTYSIGTLNDIPVIMVEVPAIWIDGSIVKLQMLQRLDEVASNMELLKLTLVVVIILATIPILLSNMILSGLILRPIDQLSSAMKKSSTSGTYEKIEEANDGRDELAQIGKTFNGMMETLESNYKKQQQFVSNASHELKTPLTVIESYAKLLVRRGFSNEKVAYEALEAIVNESQRMKDMIEQMLQLAKNKENISLSITKINLHKLIENTLSQMQHAYNRHFELQSELHFEIYTDEQKLKQLLFILLDNARKYSEDHILVQILKQKAHIEIEIRDFGFGIPNEHIPHLFDRFYRVSQDRNRKTGGTGLGLSIAKEIADLLQIEIKVESEVGVGTTFTLTIPIQMDDPKEDSQ